MYKKSDADDWTKVDDKALRKKLQNRLAKRKSSKSDLCAEHCVELKDSHQEREGEKLREQTSLYYLARRGMDLKPRTQKS